MKAAITSRPISTKSSMWLLSLFAGCLAAVLTGFSQPVQAQTSADLQTPVGSSDRNASANSEFGSVNNLLDLMRRVQQGSIRDPYQFGSDQQQNINSQASTFRQRQAELLKQQDQMGVSPSSQIVAPDSQEIR